MQIGSDTPATTYAMGTRVCGTLDNYPGTVVAVGETTFGVRWADGMYPITYPVETVMVRRAMPWE